ncbi:glycosyltransferase family 2 protein [Myceligenerans pegani]|uniref:Glycosyltransferase n=1 Tax=Myceligenerans pegani TaxID=2776917 RepID=A0ABR9MYV4_9MICO|nr:glycosyltransferase [Myceligenerans sp. TRM 65318]MBE1876568.1 glycosyltransferase [Myceligenerans sp. TRM 65318]MBE3018839.1 glycosyltransferase [Myceligenerans sp. TRM 65318]
MEPEDDRVTVVVATRNRREDLLASLPRHRSRVFLVDNASTDGSPGAVAAARPATTVIRLRRNVGAVARNVGVEAANSPYVAFADDDSWWAPGSLGRAARTLAAHPRLGLVCARILVGPEERTDPTSAAMARSPLPRDPQLPGEPLLGFVACAAMVRRSAFLAVGGFDPVVRFPGEEERLALDLAAAGWAMAYLQDVVVHHHPSPVRHSPDRRRRGLARAATLNALMRLPWRDAIGEIRRVAATSPSHRAGVLHGLREAPAALRRRRPLPADVMALRALLAPW